MFMNVQLQLFRWANVHWIKGTIHPSNQRYIFSLSPVVLFIHLLFWCELPSFEDNSRRDACLRSNMMEPCCTLQTRISKAACLSRNHDPVANDNPQSLLACSYLHQPGLIPTLSNIVWYACTTAQHGFTFQNKITHILSRSSMMWNMSWMTANITFLIFDDVLYWPKPSWRCC